MAASKRISSKKYGVRYGRTIRERLGKLEKARRESNQCPYCSYKSLVRVAAGIWSCKKCLVKFTGRAYVVGKKVDAPGQSIESQARATSEDAK
jgi:ribosomal protein L37AE/L43A